MTFYLTVGRAYVPIMVKRGFGVQVPPSASLENRMDMRFSTALETWEATGRYWRRYRGKSETLQKGRR